MKTLRDSTESIDTQDDLLPLLERLGISCSRLEGKRSSADLSIRNTKIYNISVVEDDDDDEEEVVYLLDSEEEEGTSDDTTSSVDVSDYDSRQTAVHTRTYDDASSLSHAAFSKKRPSLARDMYQEYNAVIFDSQLPTDLDISWNARLATTAGLTHYSKRYDIHGTALYTARIELATKVLDTADRLERTLIHEMCHCAAWLIDHVARPPHGHVFKKWADRAMRILPRVDVSTCHNYDIFYPYRWQCTTCFHEYKRHSNSINVDKKVCGSCRGRLEYLGKFNREGKASPKKKKMNAYSQYVAENFSRVKQDSDPGTTAVDVMKKIAAMWHTDTTCARGPTILAECDTASSSSDTASNSLGPVVIEVLEKVDLRDGERCSYSVHGITLHVMRKRGILFLCAASESTDTRSVPFAFLVDVSERFFQQHGDVAETALAYECDVSFSPVMQERMAYYNNPRVDMVKRVREEVHGLRQVMVDNIELVMERGEQLHVLVDKTDDLDTSAVVFKRGTLRMSRQMWWKEKKAMVMLIALGVVLLYAVFASICGLGLSQCLSSSLLNL